MPALEYFLEVAAGAGLPVDLHTDEHLDPARSTLAHLAHVVASTGFAHTVTASHCVRLGLRPVDEQRRVAEALAVAGVHVVALPSTNLFLQGREQQQAMPRALAPVAALRAAGVNVAAGWDNLQDPFNPMGRGDCLETAALMSMVGHLLPDEAYHSVSNAGRAIIGLPLAGTEVGMAADLVLIPERTTRAAIAGAPSGRTVIRRGVVVTSPA
jgi:cytosine deaminase